MQRINSFNHLDLRSIASKVAICMGIIMKKKLMKVLAITALTAILGSSLTACSQNKSPAQDAAGADASSGKVRIGSKDFTENLILGEVYALALEDNGFEVERIFNISSSVVHTTIVNDEIDLYPEYTGTGLLSVLEHELVTDPQEVYDIVKAQYEEKFDLIWLDYAQANDGQGLVITKKISDEYGITTISDLQANAENVRFASQGEFDEREDGIPALTETYGPFNFASSKVYDNGLKYQVLLNDEADAAPAYTTEGQLVEDDFVLLEDDKQVWPPYNIAPVIRKEVLDTYPDIESILNQINQNLDTETVTSLNAKVDVDKQEYEEVAKEYYESIK